MTLRWGLVAPGRIAHKFADALQRVPGHALHRVAGRDLARAQAFAAQWCHPGGQASASVEALCADPTVDIVYIASPHSAHAAQATLALQAGKPVLCEKALTHRAAEAEALVALAQRQGLFLMEAVWSRFLPAWERAASLVREGSLGRVQRVQSSFCFAPPYEPTSRLFDPALAGGALLDLGVYNLHLGLWMMQVAGQGAVRDWSVTGSLAPTGVEQRASAVLRFEGGAELAFTCALDGLSSNALHLEAEKGWLAMDAHFHRADALRWQRAGQEVQVEAWPYGGNGFEGQIQACAEALSQGWREHPRVPHADTLAVMRWIDAFRARLGAQ